MYYRLLRLHNVLLVELSSRIQEGYGDIRRACGFRV